MAWTRRDGWLLPLGAIFGSLLAPLFHAVPPGWQLTAGVAAGLLCLLVAPLRAVGAVMLACCWSLWNFQVRLDDRLPADLAGGRMTVSGIITSIPQEYGDFSSFRFAPDRGGTGTELPKSPHAPVGRKPTANWAGYSTSSNFRMRTLPLT